MNIVDSRAITGEHVWAHQTQDGTWFLQDTYNGTTSTTTYPTFAEARTRYLRGEVPFMHD